LKKLRRVCSPDPTAAAIAGPRCSLLATAKLNGVEPFAYLRDVLQRVVGGHPARRLDDLLP
jgi:hypothetical protein